MPCCDLSCTSERAEAVDNTAQHVNMMERLQRHVMVSSDGMQSLSKRTLPLLSGCSGGGRKRARGREGERERCRVQRKHCLMQEAGGPPDVRNAPPARFAEAQVSCESHSQNAGSAKAGRCSSHLEAVEAAVRPTESPCISARVSCRMEGGSGGFLSRLLPDIHAFEAFASSRLLQWLKEKAGLQSL